MKMKYILGLVAVLGVFILGNIPGRLVVTHRTAGTQDFVEGTVPLNLDDLVTRINQGQLGTTHREAGFATIQLDIGSGPKEFEMGPISNMLLQKENGNPALEQYLQLPSETKINDIFVGGTADGDWDDDKWFSEYTALGKPVPFQCGFILHFEAIGPNQTKVEVLETGPSVTYGRRFQLNAHAMGMLPDTWLVAPTTSDRVSVLKRVQSLARA
jgi:hypothetical protein